MSQFSHHSKTIWNLVWPPWQCAKLWIVSFFFFNQ